jgi:hypothetical protein
LFFAARVGKHEILRLETDTTVTDRRLRREQGIFTPLKDGEFA